MGIFDFIKNEFIEVIEWVDQSNDTVIWKFTDQGNKIMNGAKLTVRESQNVVLMNEGEFGDLYLPGLHTLSTSNMPITTTLKSWKYLFDSPFKVDIYFISTKQFTNLKWGTSGAILLRDKEFGQVRLKSFGNFSIRIIDSKKFIKEFSGTKPYIKVDDVEGQLKAVIASKFAEGIAQASIPVLDLATNYTEIGDKLMPVFQQEFDTWGIQLEKFYIESIMLPEEVEKILDKKTNLNILKNNLNEFNQFQAGLSIENISENPGAGDTAGIGAGILLNNLMGQNIQNQQGNTLSKESSSSQQIELLKQLGELKQAGILSEEEFNIKKQEILSKL